MGWISFLLQSKIGRLLLICPCIYLATPYQVHILVGKPEGKNHLEDLDVDGKLDLRQIGWGRCGLDSSDLGKQPVAGFCEHGDEPSGSIKS
jgi:hypothetical protein